MLPADMLRMLQHISRLRLAYSLLKITKEKTYFSEENPALELVCAGAPGSPAAGLSVPLHGGGRGHGG